MASRTKFLTVPHLEHIRTFAPLGFDRIYLHNVGRNQREWIDMFAEHVLPHLGMSR